MCIYLSASFKSTSVESTSVESTSVESQSVESTSVESTSVESTSVESTLVESTSVESTSVESASVESTLVESSSFESTSVESQSVESTSVESKDKNPCSVDGVIFQDGEKFQPHCSQLCTCQNGFYGCVNQCPQELQKPSELTCHEPKLITVNNKCCKEWTCQKIEASGSLHRGLESENLVNHRHFTKVPPPTSSITPTSLANHHSVSCHEEQTDWSPCPYCGVGLITKHVTLRQNCIKIVKEKLCYIRPCQKKSLFTRVEGGPDKCTPTTRGQDRQKIKYEDCVSVKSYKLKFCTNCMTDKCCYPEKIKTKKIKFQCTDGKIIDLKFVWIKKCRCDVCDKIDQPHEFSPNRFKNYLRLHREKRFIV
ncbi:G1/S-specific cyclin ccn1 [Bulinus truncatus]|nr:G1/S-specific cyclin ccn1 [Bulinus truncatus]